MYFGSVKFFKHLILTVFFGWLAAATILAVYFGAKCVSLERSASDSDGDPEMLRQYIDEMTEAGFSYDEISTYLDIIREDEGTVPEEHIVSEEVRQEPLSQAEDIPEETAASETSAPVAAGYADLFPDMYTAAVREKYSPDSRTVFLVFQGASDGITDDTLTILDSHDIKAVFLTDDPQSADDRLLKRIADSGHSLGAVMNGSYKDTAECLSELSDVGGAVMSASGEFPSLYLPSGSQTEAMTDELVRRGFSAVTPNAAPDDCSSRADWQSLYNEAMSAVHSNSDSGSATVLMLHNGPGSDLTVLTADDIITDLEAEGYSFSLLTPSVYIN